MGLFVAGLLNAAKSPQGLRKWRMRYGVVESLMEIRDYAESFSMALNASTINPNEIWYEFARNSQGIRLEGYEESYRITADSIFPIIAYEVLELFRAGKTFQWCPCGKLYVTRSRQRANHCAECKEPSRMPVKLLPEEKKTARREATLKRVKEYHARKRKEAAKGGLSKKDRERIRLSIDRMKQGGWRG